MKEGIFMTEKELFLLCCGTDKKGFPKTIVSLEVGLLNLSDNPDQTSFEEFNRFITQSAIVNIERTMYHTKIDLTFEDGSTELKKMWKEITEFNEFVEKTDLLQNNMPNTILTISPIDDDRYIIQATYGICSLTGTDPEKPCDMITMIYPNELVKCLELAD